MDVILIVLAILVTVVTGILLVRRHKPAIVLVAAGLFLLFATVILRPGTALLDEDNTSGSVWFDIFGTIEDIMGTQLTGVGLIIMAAGGFSAYMNKIGATRALVELVAAPIARLRRPYLMLVLAYLMGQALFMVIPSAAGLAILLLVLLVPILVATGVSAAAAGAVIVTATAFPLGPAAGTSVLAASTVGLSPAVYFVQNQLPVAGPAILAVAITHFFVQRWMDRKNTEQYQTTTADAATLDAPAAPKAYCLFLVLPIALLIIFSPLVNQSIELSTVSAFLMVWVLAVIVELVRSRKMDATFNGAMAMFTGMGKMFGSVVSLIIAAQLFAEGLKMTGLIDGLITAAEGAGVGLAIVSILFTLVVGLVTFLSGSGVGAFSAFAALGPSVAEGLGGSATTIVTPMQFASGLFRAVSPISAVVIAVAGGIGISPMALVKRTAIPMGVGALVMMVMSLVVI